MTPLFNWAQRNNISLSALQDLQRTLGLLTPPMPAAKKPGDKGTSEAYVQSLVRLEASEKNVTLFRNNVGAWEDKSSGRARWVRYGLANDSSDLNEAYASADLIGIRPILIGPQHVGHTIGQFVSREVKELGWQYTGTEHEVAQFHWMSLILVNGGDAAFCADVGSL